MTILPRTIPAALLGLTLVGGTALAPAALAQRIAPPPSDQVVLQLQAEEWVETKTAKLAVSVETVLSGEQAAQQAGKVPPVLNELAQGDWRVTSSDRSRDASGLERWRVMAEVRLPESALGGIYDKARQLSKPGQQLEVNEVDFSPTLAEREATAAKLRADIYRRAAEEAAEAAKVWPDQGFRVHRVDFETAGMPRPVQRMSMAKGDMQAMAAPAAAEAYGVSERLVLRATVVLAAPAPDGKRDRDRRRDDREDDPGRGGSDRDDGSRR